MELAAEADVLGIGGDIALDSDDPVDQLLLRARVERAFEARQALHEDLAERIGYAVIAHLAEVMGGD